MRTAFIETLVEQAERDARVWLLNGDLGYSVLERFRDRFPDRYVNVGVAEQNLIGVAAGLAMHGLIPFVYSIANFPTLRCLEQIRNDVCYHELPVRVVAVGGGFTYGAQGYTHHGIEDIGILRTLPGMTVVAPGDPVETRLATRALLDLPGPAYLRLGKAGEPLVHTSEPAGFALGRATRVRDGGDITFITTGGMLKHATDVADALSAEGISVRVLSMHTVKPLDGEAVWSAALETRGVITVEEHTETNGLGSAVADVLAQSRRPRAAFRKFAMPDRLHHRIGDQNHMRALAGDLAQVARELLRDGEGQP